MKKKPEGWDEAFALTGRVKFVYLSSLDEEGGPETRVLFNLRKMRAKPIGEGPAALGEGFGTYLGTNASSRKASQLRKEGRVCLYYSDNAKFQGCTVKGRVEELEPGQVKDALWKPEWEMYYPGGKDGGDFAVFKFIPESVRYYHGLKVLAFDA